MIVELLCFDKLLEAVALDALTTINMSIISFYSRALGFDFLLELLYTLE